MIGDAPLPAPIAIPDALRAQIYAHARAAFPAECCGYLTGPAAAGDAAAAASADPAAAVDAVIPCRNAQADGEHPTHPHRGADAGFVIAGAELFAFAQSFGGPRPARVVYHSHPGGRAYFSAIDQDLAHGPAYPVQHLVVGVTARGATEAAQLAWSAAADAYVEVARWAIPELP
ncbi:MAG TPA: Mov34/MPN/PAD-1 family protein [Kofleriaceae bacterium]|nr:Mov34/MPN/PAD-1 family protein [Kofleriaceae bacterium]